jgi:predicted flap endonuclease-1-like 5' DNA nuclease
MTPLIAFILGLLVGWLVEWIIDWFYWRRRGLHLQGATDECQQKVASLEADLATSRKEVLSLREKARQLDLEKSRLETIAVQSQPEPAAALAPSVPPKPDDLDVIKGIGPVITRLLNGKGITTFEQLAAQTPESLRILLGDVIEHLADEESLIEQARQLALLKQSKGAGGK